MSVVKFCKYVAACFFLLCVAGYFLNATTINGIPSQIISNLSNHGVVLGQGTNDVTSLVPGTSGQALISNGSSSDPSYQTMANAGLTNSSVTINTTGCVSGGGTVSLGATLTLASSSCGGWSGVSNASPGATPTWTLQNGDISWTLSTNASPTVTVVSGDRWVHHTVQICQPVGGPFTVTWPSNVKGGMVIGTTSSKCNMQMFVSYDGTNLYAVDTGVLNQ